VRAFWGKYNKENGKYHPLVHHCADVAACFEALARIPSINRTLSHLGNFDKDCLPPEILARLSVFAYVHDLGKVARGFQYQIHSARPQNAPPKKGHLKPFANLLWDDPNANEWFSSALGFNEVLSWPAEHDHATASLMMAALAHHGLPLKCDGNTGFSERNQWILDQYLNPSAEIKRHGDLIRQWFPIAFNQTNIQLPANSHFHHYFCGLVALADWIGSDQNRFKFVAPVDENYIHRARRIAIEAVVDIGLDISEQRCTFMPPEVASRLIGYNTLRPLQQTVLDAPVERNILILEAETGAGKTEAALLRFFRLYNENRVDGMYFAVPTRTAAIQLHKRINEFTKRMLSNDTDVQVVLAVPGYYQAGDANGIPQPEFTVQWDDDPSASVAARRWAAESSKRYLAAQISVGTVDQVMMSELPVKHSHMRSTMLSRHFVVIDELHASDRYMQQIIQRVIATTQLRAGHVLMMSATLGADARQNWLCDNDSEKTTLSDASSIQYPSLSYYDGNTVISQPIAPTGYTKAVRIKSDRSDSMDWRQLLIQAANDGAKVLVIRNTVDAAIEVFNELSTDKQLDNRLLFNVNGVNTLHHSRFAAEDRKLLDAEVEHRLGKKRSSAGCIVVGTQTLEMSLDIDADLLITDLCPVDVLLQRIGRLHRHERNDRPANCRVPRAIVLAPDTKDLSKLLHQSDAGLGAKAKVYPDIVALQNTLELINQHSEWQLPAMNRFLVESALHCQARERQLSDRGSDWQEADQRNQGADIANQQTASQLRVAKHQLFTNDDVIFPHGIDVLTRLGGDKLDVKLASPVTGPFGQQVQNFSIPDWLLCEPMSDYVDRLPDVSHGSPGLLLIYPERTFLYGPTGLTVLADE
jgi:CRISPR-associated endonuclease/helicase Cas3